MVESHYSGQSEIFDQKVRTPKRHLVATPEGVEVEPIHPVARIFPPFLLERRLIGKGILQRKDERREGFIGTWRLWQLPCTSKSPGF
jgi:hypothetical protein